MSRTLRLGDGAFALMLVGCRSERALLHEVGPGAPAMEYAVGIPEGYDVRSAGFGATYSTSVSGGGNVGSVVFPDASVAELRTAFGLPDSTARNEYVLLGPSYPDGHPLYWFYPAASFLVLPDSTVTLVRLDVAPGAAFRFDGGVLDGTVRQSEAARRFPLSWTCRGAQSSNWDTLGDEDPTTEALTLIDSTAAPSRPLDFRRATLRFDDGRLVEIVG